jgi:uncharacterized iron-regulated protein
VSSGRFLFFFLRASGAALFACCASCGFFYRQPALPKRAAIEARETPQADEKYAALVADADIIYLPTELPGSAPWSEPTAKLVEALRRSEHSFAIGWGLIGGDEQAFLDHWTKHQLSTDAMISRLHLSGTSGERENCRAFLSATKESGARFLALGCPADLSAAIRPGAMPDASARSELLGSFQPPPGDYRRFAERSPAARGLNETQLHAAYEAALLEEEFAAERIVGYFRDHRDEKVIVFVHRRHLQSARGVPYFVAQKIKARQLVLDAAPGRSSRSQLLAGRRDGGIGRRFEIVDGSPGTGHNQF